jgi:hypothetical protein
MLRGIWLLDGQLGGGQLGRGALHVSSGGRVVGAVGHPHGRLIVKPGGVAESTVDSGGIIQMP